MAKNKNSYKYQIGKRVLVFKSNTLGGAYDKAIHWKKKYAQHQSNPVLIPF